MKFSKVSYEKVYPIAPFINERLGIEIQLEENEGVNEALDTAKEILDLWHMKKHPDLYIQTKSVAPLAEIPKQKYEASKTLAEQIQSVTDLKVLDSYRLIVKGKPEEEVFYLKFAELSQRNQTE